MSLDERPRPLKDAASKLSTVLGVLGAVVTALSGWLLTASQTDALTGLLGAIPGVFTAVVAVLAAFGVVRAGEPQVTPLSDPRDNDGKPLTA